MPIYEYLCEECQKPFERIVLSKSERICCPKCGSERYTLKFSVVTVKGGDGSYSPGTNFSPGGGGGCCGGGGCGCH